MSMNSVGLRHTQQGTGKGARNTLPFCSHTLRLLNLSLQDSRATLLSALSDVCFPHCRSAEVDAAQSISENLTGNVLGKAGPVPVEIGNVIVEELHNTGFEAHKPVASAGEIHHILDILHQGVALKDGGEDLDAVLGADAVLLIVQGDAKSDVAELHNLGHHAVQRHELLVVANLNVEGVVGLAIGQLVDVPNNDVGILLEQSLDLLLVGVPGGFQFEIV